MQNGFTIGIGDTIADAGTMETINQTIANAKEEVKRLIREAQEKKLEAEPGRTMMESFENRVNQVLRLDCCSAMPHLFCLLLQLILMNVFSLHSDIEQSS